MIDGDSSDQYSKLWDYAETLKEKNPGSTVILQLQDTPTGKRFKRFYVCLGAVKSGFLSGCRPWIGVDGCHLSGLTIGVLLTAVCMDPNNDPYPLAYAVVPVENKESWEWFLQFLKEDLLIERQDIYTFMSDKQKGLIGAFENVLPDVENRFCVRHLHGNMKRAGFRGQNFKTLLWKAANAATVADFTSVMQEIQQVDNKCLEWLQTKSPKQWSKSHFSTFGKCDTLVNNMCEQFNHCLLDARDKSILTMLEWIRTYMMSRLQRYRDRAKKKWKGRKICGRISEIVEINMKASKDCFPRKSSDLKYEVSNFEGSSRYVVNLEDMSCDCRRWDLNGIPCKHAISAICAEGLDPEDFVNNCYSVDTYNSVYSHAICSMNSEELWKIIGYIPPLPPTFHKKKKGRPQKQRKFGATESPSKKLKKTNKSQLQKLGKQPFKVTCSFCAETGHNRARCELRKATNVSTHVVEEMTQPEVQDTTHLVVQNLTQPDYFKESQDDQGDVDFTDQFASFMKKPTTRQGRKEFAMRRVKFSSTIQPTDDVESHEKSSQLYNISTSVSDAQPKKMGVMFKAPPSMSFHPNHVIGGPSTGGAKKSTEGERLKVFTAARKKFTTLSSLRAASKKGKGERET